LNVNQKDIDGNSPLSIACSSEALGSIAVLIAFGADLYSRNKQMETPLWVAARFGHIKTMRILIENYGCKTGFQNKDGIDEKEAAVKYGQLEVYQYLLGK
jgi:exosome complex exonuclease RRP6